MRLLQSARVEWEESVYRTRDTRLDCHGGYWVDTHRRP
jgi:hypothetical protein